MTEYTPDQIREHREQWLAELRSGNRQQVTGYLACTLPDDANEVGYCCLGVATELAGVVSVSSTNRPYRLYANAGTDEYLVLPYEAKLWLGVTHSDPDLGFEDVEEDWDYVRGVLDPEVFEQVSNNFDEGSHVTGAMLNDAGATFAQIADLFEHFGFSAQHDVLQDTEVVA